MSSDYRHDPTNTDEFLDLDEARDPEELESKVQKAKSELEELRRRQEQIEREKQRLEELGRRQEEFENGRGEMLDKFGRGIGVVEREIEESRRRVESLQTILGVYKNHMQVLDRIQPKTWTTTELQKELSGALSALEAARSEYNKSQARLSAEIPESAAELEDTEVLAESDAQTFTYWLKAGFAFTLPLQILVLLGAGIWLVQLLTQTK
jgi:DNA repair exonuclease SbcCD ATPase subunit